MEICSPWMCSFSFFHSSGDQLVAMELSSGYDFICCFWDHHDCCMVFTNLQWAFNNQQQATEMLYDTDTELHKCFPFSFLLLLTCCMKHLNTGVKFKHKTCFSILALRKSNTSLRPANGLMLRSVYVISGRHLLSTQKSSSGSRVQCYSRRSFSLGSTRSFEPTQAFAASLCFHDYDLKLCS